jgi:hypothetical protein
MTVGKGNAKNRIINFREIKFNILWNVHEENMNGESLAKIIVEDLGLPTSYELDISNQVKNAILDYKKTKSSWNNLGSYPNSKFTEDILKADKKEKYCTIILDLEAEGVSYQDRFEWDIFNEKNDPSEFAKIIVCDLGLPPCFERLINFEISKQVII